jgi:hypothetical protein
MLPSQSKNTLTKKKVMSKIKDEKRPENRV